MGNLTGTQWNLRAWDAPVWVHCAAAPRLTLQAPKKERSAARDGITVHDAVLPMIRGLMRALMPTPSEYPTLKRADFEAAQVYALIVAQAARDAGVFAEPHLLLEKSIPCTLVPGVRTVKPDAVVFDHRNFILHIFDLKSGFKSVQAANNEQLIIYGLVLANYFGIGFNDERIRIQFHIVQPKDYCKKSPDDVWEISMYELSQLAKRIELAALDALEQNAVCSVGPWCAKCDAKGGCGAFGRVSATIAEIVMDDATGEMVERTPGRIAAEVDLLSAALRTIEQRLAGVVMEGEELLRQGQRIPHYTIDRGAGSENWSVSDPVVIETLKPFGVDPMRLCTPNQLRKKGELPDAVIDMLSKRTPGKAKFKRIKTANIAAAFEGENKK